MAAGILVVLPNRFEAQTVQETSGSAAYVEHAAKVLCGPRARVRVWATGASVYLSGEYLQDRNLNEVARNIALDGLNAYPDSSSFSVSIEDSKGNGYATVSH